MINFLPTHCNECGHELEVVIGKNGKYKLICPDTDNCSGVAIKKFQRGMSSFDISGIGPSTYQDLYESGISSVCTDGSISTEKFSWLYSFTNLDNVRLIEFVALDIATNINALKNTDWEQYCNLAAHNCKHISMYHIEKALVDKGYKDNLGL